MKLHRFLTILLAAVLALAPAVDAAPKKKKSRGKKIEPTPVKTEAPEKKADPSAPENHEEAYQKFFAALEKQYKENGYDTCPALTIALLATGDEFCVESWMQRAAKEGNAVAIHHIATKNLFYVPKSQYLSPEVKASVAMLKKASDMKYTPSMVDYSAFLREGIGVIKNEAEADRVLLEACRSGSFETRFSWLMQTKRLETYADLERPEVKSEIERGNHYIQYFMCQKAPDKATAVSMLTQAARRGNDRAMFELSALLSTTDIKASYQFLRLAVQYHNPDAMHHMGNLLLAPTAELTRQLGIKKNEASAITFLKVASMLGDNASRVKLSHFYYSGVYGLPKDDVKAYRHLALASVVRPDPAVYAAQGFMLMSGMGVEKDVEKGLPLLQKAVELKYPYAVALLAYCYFRGIGVEANAQQALYYLESMAVRNFPMAFVYMALMYDEGGAGLEKNPERVKYFLGHAEVGMKGRAQECFDEYKRRYGKWQLAPIGF